MPILYDQVYSTACVVDLYFLILYDFLFVDLFHIPLFLTTLQKFLPEITGNLLKLLPQSPLLLLMEEWVRHAFLNFPDNHESHL